MALAAVGFVAAGLVSQGAHVPGFVAADRSQICSDGDAKGLSLFPPSPLLFRYPSLTLDLAAALECCKAADKIQ